MCPPFLHQWIRLKRRPRHSVEEERQQVMWRIVDHTESFATREYEGTNRPVAPEQTSRASSITTLSLSMFLADPFSSRSDA